MGEPDGCHTEGIRWILENLYDPQPHNAVLMREHFKMPALDDVLPSLHNARVFTKLDVKEAFWHVRLDEQSNLLTTMITPFGRFRWARLPFQTGCQ